MRERAQRALQPDSPGWPAATARFLTENAGTLLRLHLALFYVWGTYFQPAKRVSGECGYDLQQACRCGSNTRRVHGAAVGSLVADDGGCGMGTLPCCLFVRPQSIAGPSALWQRPRSARYLRPERAPHHHAPPC